ncbi:hypothetical protein COLO4_22600 [Corchorus olitorius]|uniref:Uncharacterized protein n=1 Tax=Corchorus olitorius TaxID=93759 RepID=A0A1R3IL86_9ROSI|nr:hypothetical protein COLO4_22600 [Corchorus olitorius]
MFFSSQFDGISAFSGGGLMPSLSSQLANSTSSPAKVQIHSQNSLSFSNLSTLYDFFRNLFSFCLRRFPVVEKRWRAAYQTESESTVDDPVKYDVYSSISNSELAAAFFERKRRERRTVCGFT